MASIGLSGERSFRKYPDAVEVLGYDEQLFFSGPGLVDVDGRENPAVGELAVQNYFHVAGALEFFENYFVHAASGIDQGGGDDGQAPPLLDVSRRAEKPFRAMERVGIRPPERIFPLGGTTLL